MGICDVFSTAQYIYVPFLSIRNFIYSGAAGACAGRLKVLGASAGEAGIETGDPPKKNGDYDKSDLFFVIRKTPPTFGGKFHF